MRDSKNPQFYVMACAETLADTVRHLRKSAVRFTDPAEALLADLADGDFAVRTGRTTYEVVTPRMLGMDAPATCLGFDQLAVASGYDRITLQAALRSVIDLPRYKEGVRFHMEPINDGGYDTVLTCSWENDLPVVGIDESGLWEYNADKEIGLDQRVVVALPDPAS